MSDGHVVLGDHSVMAMPPPNIRGAFNVGEHRMVQVIFGDDEMTDAKWMCFDHGPECWTTAALRRAASEGADA